MPHLVANFLRPSSNNHSHKKRRGNDSNNSSSSSSRTNSLAPSPYASDSDDHHAVKMPDQLAETLKKHHHRLSLPFARLSSRDAHHHHHHHHHGHGSSSAAAGVSLDWSVESPPIVFHGSPDESTGALISGQMFMDVLEDSVDVDFFTAALNLVVTQKRPFQAHCGECQLQTTEVKAWRLLVHPTATTLTRGRHLFPFSALLDGHLPASMDTPLVSIAYAFKAEAIIVRGSGTSCASVRFERAIHVKRSLPEPLYPHHSVRVFPPTNIKASAHYNSVIHPTSNNRLTLKLDGLMTHHEKANTVDLWRLKKISWKLEETIKTMAPPCDKHVPESAAAADEHDHVLETPPPPPPPPPPPQAKKAVARSDTRVLGDKQLHDGWKSDFSGSDGTVDMEFDFCVNQCKPHSRDLKFACDTKTRDGIEVTHSLLIELIVSKEYAPEGKTHLATQTGTGRILRMHFAVVMTDFPGLGVSWDNEAPPVYQDVPPSPPGYPCHEGRGPPVEYEHLEALDARRASVEALDARHRPLSGASSKPLPPRRAD